MVSTKEKLSQVRTECLGFSEEIYILIEYVSETLDNTDEGAYAVIMTLAIAIEKLKSKEENFLEENSTLNFLKNKKEQVLKNLGEIPRVIEEIFGQDFAAEFGEYYKSLNQLSQ